MNEKKEKRKMRNTEGRGGGEKKRKPGFIQKNTLFWNGCWK